MGARQRLSVESHHGDGRGGARLLSRRINFGYRGLILIQSHPSKYIVKLFFVCIPPGGSSSRGTRFSYHFPSPPHS